MLLMLEHNLYIITRVYTVARNDVIYGKLQKYIISAALQNNKQVQKWTCESYDSYSNKPFLSKNATCLKHREEK
jgi:hypothetical protein